MKIFWQIYMDNRPRTIVISSFDWDNLAEKNPDAVIQKLTRDKLRPDENKFLIISWGPGRYEKNIAPNVRVIRRKARYMFLRPLYDFLTFLHAPAIVRQSGMTPDLFLAYDFPMTLALSQAARQSNVPLVLVLTNLPQRYLRTRPQWIVTIPYLWVAERLARKFITAVYTINQTCKEYALNLNIQESRIVLFISDTIVRDRSLIEVAREGLLRTNFGIPVDKKIILTVARLEHEKGLDRLIEAFSALRRKDIVLVVAGKGSLRPELERLAKERGVAERTVFTGSVSREKIWSFYKDADVFILLSRAEALGLVFWEAMYVGVPVIGSRAKGIVETIGTSEERGFLWEPEDSSDALEKRINLCLDEGVVMQERLRLARAYVEEKISDTTDINTVYQLCRKS